MRQSLLDLKHMVIESKQYHTELPNELKEYYAYIRDCGHSIMCVLVQHLESAIKEGIALYEIPVPVKYVLENPYKVTSECVIVNAEYCNELGLITDEKYDEY